MTQKRPALFRGRHFEDVIILLCVRWYLRYSLTYRDLEEIIAERGLSIDHVTIWRWVQRYAPVLNQRIRRELRSPNRSWRVDETYVKLAGDWAYLYRAVDSTGETIEFMLSPKRDLIAAKLFLRLALSGGGPPPRVRIDQDYVVAEDDPTRVCRLATVTIALAEIDARRDLPDGAGRLLRQGDDERHAKEDQQQTSAQTDRKSEELPSDLSEHAIPPALFYVTPRGLVPAYEYFLNSGTVCPFQRRTSTPAVFSRLEES